MFYKNNIVDELKSFYYQNVMTHLYIFTTMISAIIIGLIESEFYWLLVISSLFPFAYESFSSRLKDTEPKYYYRLGLYLNSIIISLFIFSVSFEPSLSGLIILMYTYTLISYGGWRLFLMLFPTLALHLFILTMFFGNSDVLHVPYQIVATSLIASCCFMAVIASYRYDAGVELVESKKKLKSVLKKQSILTKNLSRYLSSKLVETLINEDESIEKHQRREITVFFSDLCNFTSISEELSPEDMSLILNQYLSRMSKIANSYGATIDKFIGDSVMVFFGAPSSLGPKQDALRCLDMAIDMKKGMEDLNKKWKELGYSHRFKVRMGIHQGWATVGNFGAKDLVNYTAIGTAVNIAARLEQNCAPSDILVSQKVFEVTKDEFQFSDNGSMALKGIESPVQTHILNGKHQYGSKKVKLIIEANENNVDTIRWELRKAGVIAREE